MKKVIGILVVLILVVSFFGVGYILIQKSIKPDEVKEVAGRYFTKQNRTVATLVRAEEPEKGVAK